MGHGIGTYGGSRGPTGCRSPWGAGPSSAPAQAYPGQNPAHRPYTRYSRTTANCAGINVKTNDDRNGTDRLLSPASKRPRAPAVRTPGGGPGRPVRPQPPHDNPHGLAVKQALR
ncbi:hypothetical protein ACF08M_24790 [Streptomyces sp. NPDC015032]|uniref:hypothetical protein n=1 Tax=Streptomyces sp. NPDC015032 TaxID=3364937 RepID=UPI0036F7D2D6